MSAVRYHGRPRVDHLARLAAPAAFGLDGTSFVAATAEHPILLVTDRGSRRDLADDIDAMTTRCVPLIECHDRRRITSLK
jgi:hypothetical protein